MNSLLDGKDADKVLKEGDSGDFPVEKDGETVMAGYVVSDDHDPENEFGVILTNKLKPKKMFTVRKVWENDDENSHEDTVVKVELQKKEVRGGDWTTLEVLELNDAGGWTGNFKPAFYNAGDKFRVCERDGKDNLLTASGETGYFEVENYYPGGWQPAWHAYEVDYDFDEEEDTFIVSNQFKQRLIISADLKWENDDAANVSDDSRIHHEKPVTAVLRLWDEEQGGWVEKEEIQLTEANNWKGTFSNNEISADDRWEVRERDKDGNLVENDGALVPFTVTQGGVEKQENYAVKYSVFNYDPLNPTTIITNKGSADRADCKIRLVWEDEEEGISHKPVLVDVVKICKVDKNSQVEDPVGEANLNNDNGWETTLYTNNNTVPRNKNTIARISCSFINDEGRTVIVSDSVEDYEDPVSQAAGNFTCYKNGEPVSYDYRVTSTTSKRQDASGVRHFTTTITLTRVNLGMRTCSVRVNWLGAPAGYKPDSLTAQLLHSEYVEGEKQWVPKENAVLNNNNNWAHAFAPLPDDGDEGNYLVDLLDEDGERMYIYANTYVGNPVDGEDLQDELLTGYIVAKFCVRNANGVENIVEYAINGSDIENNLTTIQCGIVHRFFSIRNIRKEEPPVTFADGDTPVRSTYILQHRYNGEWFKVKQSDPNQPEDGKFFEIKGQWNDDDYQVREIDEQGNAVEENGTIVLSARKDGTPLHLQYKVNYGAYGEFQAGEFPVTKTLQGRVFPTEIKWEDGEAQSPVQAIVQSSPAGAENWSEVQDSTAELSAQNQWAAPAGPVPWEEGKKYRVRVKAGGQVIDDEGEAEISGKQYYITYEVDQNGKTVINAKRMVKRTFTVVKEWDAGGLGINTQTDPDYVIITLQRLENGNWKDEEQKKIESAENQGGNGAGWRNTFEVVGWVNDNYRVIEEDFGHNDIEEGQTGDFQVNLNGNPIEAPFKVSYQFQADVENAENGGTFRIKNTYDPEKTSVNVSVTDWDDHENEDGLRPDSVTVRLLANGQDTGQTVALNGNNNYQASFNNLNKKDAQLQDIPYSVQVQNDNVITGQDGKLTYSSETGGDAANGYTVTLKHTPQTVTHNVTVNWEDNNDQDYHRPLSVDVVLTAGNGGNQGNENKHVLHLQGDGNQWNGQFQPLPAVRNGQEINYAVVENENENHVNHYQFAAVQNNNGFNITYTHLPESISISGIVLWHGDEQHIAERPQSVEIGGAS